MAAKFYQSFLYALLALSIGFSLFLVVSDNVSPFTTQATVYRTVANIAPQVSGVVTSVKVKNGEQVKAGQVLFTIDKQSFQLAEQQAQAELKQAQESNNAKSQQLQVAQQTLSQRQVEWQNAKLKLSRYRALVKKALLDKQAFDDEKANAAVAESAVQAAQADVLRIKAELSNSNQPSAAVVSAEVKLKTAQLNLARTDVVAQTAGTVSNLQLQAGTYVNQGNVSMFLVNESNDWVSADFNEKGMDHLHTGTPVWVVFDALPGQVFSGKIINQDQAIYDASNPSNQLSTVKNDTHWIREPQKIRIRIEVQGVKANLISGARASVMVKNGNVLIDAIGASWIHIVSWFRYIY